MSAAVAQDGRIVWARGFGTANVERGIPAGPDTIYHLASLAKPYASTVLLQLVEEGRLDLDTPVSRFGITLERSSPVTVRHLLSHTSEEPPGARYRYDGNAFGKLTEIIERAGGQPFARTLADRIIRRLALTHTGPIPAIRRDFGRCLCPWRLARTTWHERALSLPRPESSEDRSKPPWRRAMRRVGPRDLADGTLRTHAAAAARIRVTFVILANSDGLSRGRGLGDNGDVSSSPAATLFLNWHSSRKPQ